MDYHEDKFRTYFTSPFDLYKDRIGQQFKVLGHDEKAESELETFEEMYLIEFNDGSKITAWGHEVCKLNYEKYVSND